jgi:hypothetical protein
MLKRKGTELPTCQEISVREIQIDYLSLSGAASKTALSMPDRHRNGGCQKKAGATVRQVAEYPR